MSMDYRVYLGNVSAFSTKQCEAYMAGLGLEAEFHPGYDIRTHTGFLPFRLEGGFLADALADKVFLSGFEVQLDPYDYAPPVKKPEGLLGGLFGKRAELVETPFDTAVKGATQCLTINCSAQDSFEPLLAYAFGAYLCKAYGGVFEDPQEGAFYTEEPLILVRVQGLMDWLRERYRKKELSVHDFVKWD